MQLFSAAVPLEFLQIDILGQLLTKKSKNQLWLVITDRFFKLAKTGPLIYVLAGTVAKVFIDNEVLVYGRQKWHLSDSGSCFSSKLFQHICRTLSVSS